MRLATKRAIICMLMLAGLSACGGGNTATNSGSSGGGAPSNSATPANQPGDDIPKEPDDPNAYRKVKAATPDGWRSLNSGAKDVFERHFKPKTEWKYLVGVMNNKTPGATEGTDEEWGEWEHKAAGAMLYFVPGEKLAPKAAVENYARDLAAGEPDIKEGGGVAWTQMQGGEIVVFGISNKHGTYVAVGVVLTTEPEPAREAIRKWAESVIPE